MRCRSIETGLSFVLAAVALPGAAADVPPAAASPEMEAAQQEADADYAAGRYAEAYEIYLGDLAPAGDKYAQYMIGVMHGNGLGVQQDAALGAAWLELAAERGDDGLEAARDDALAQLPVEERLREQALFAELLGLHGDCALVGRLLAEDRRHVTASTGSRLSSTVDSPLAVIEMQDADQRGVDQQSLREQIRKRERFLRERCR